MYILITGANGKKYSVKQTSISRVVEHDCGGIKGCLVSFSNKKENPPISVSDYDVENFHKKYLNLDHVKGK
jgi:hypothetical protein